MKYALLVLAFSLSAHAAPQGTQQATKVVVTKKSSPVSASSCSLSVSRDGLGLKYVLSTDSGAPTYTFHVPVDFLPFKAKFSSPQLATDAITGLDIGQGLLYIDGKLEIDITSFPVSHVYEDIVNIEISADNNLSQVQSVQVKHLHNPLVGSASVEDTVRCDF